MRCVGGTRCDERSVFFAAGGFHRREGRKRTVLRALLVVLLLCCCRFLQLLFRFSSLLVRATQCRETV